MGLMQGPLKEGLFSPHHRGIQDQRGQEEEVAGDKEEEMAGMLEEGNGKGMMDGESSSGQQQGVTRPQWRFVMPVQRLDGMGGMISDHAPIL